MESDNATCNWAVLDLFKVRSVNTRPNLSPCHVTWVYCFLLCLFIFEFCVAWRNFSQVGYFPVIMQSCVKVKKKYD